MLLELFIVGSLAYVGIKAVKGTKSGKKDKNTSLSSGIVHTQNKQTNPKKDNKTIKTIYEWLFTDQTRHQQIKEISFEEKRDKTNEIEKKIDKEIDKDLVIAVTSLVLAVGGTLFHSLLLRLLSTPGFIYATIPVHKNTFRLLKEGQVSVDTLATIVTVGCLAKGYFGIANLSSVFYHLSKKLLRQVKDTSQKELIDVFRQHSRFVSVFVDGVEIKTPFEALRSGDIVVANAGETIPVDGTIIEGMASIDQHILTGESQAIEKEVGHSVFASTLLLSGKLNILTEKTGSDTTVAKIGQILNNTVDFKSTIQLRAESLAQKTVLPTIIIGSASIPFLGASGALAVINAHFKYKMTAVAPISILNFLNFASHQNILIKDGRTLELLNKVDTIVFDKTGTLTEEQPHVGQIYSCSEYEADDILRYAATVEYKQTHPIARAILEESEKRQLSLSETDQIEYKLGYGLTAVIDNNTSIKVGSSRFMEVAGITVPQTISEMGELCYSQGNSLIVIALNDKLIGAIEMLPTIRQEAKNIISGLRERQKIKSMYIISGDHEMPTTKLAQQLGIEHCFAEILPENKANIIETLQKEGKCICYVGDGINDAIALKKADVSISLRGASSVAMDTAQIIFMDGGLTQLCDLFDIAKEFNTNMNMTFASILVPSIIGLGGALFLNFGLIHTIILNQISLVGGVTSAISPRFKSQRKAHDVDRKSGNAAH